MVSMPSSLLLVAASLFSTCYCACQRRGAECIEYEVIGRHNGYEERQLPPTVWISTSSEGPSLTEANKRMFPKLFSYVTGNNAKGLKFNITTPVRTRIIPCHGATCSSVFILSFLVPSEFSDSPPYPMDSQLFIEKDPVLRYVVKTFDGRPTETEWLEQSHALADLVKKDPTIDRSHSYIAWYDPPYQLFHRVNEVWLLKKTEKHTTQEKLMAPEMGKMTAETKDV